MVLQKFQMPGRESCVVEAQHWQVRRQMWKSSSCTAATTTETLLYKLATQIIEDNLEYFVMAGWNLGDIWKEMSSVIAS